MKKKIITLLTALLLVVLGILFPELGLFSEEAAPAISGNGLNIQGLDRGIHCTG